MDFRVNRETISANGELFESVAEQSVELDYTLPDYFPDIFRLMRCTITPVIIASGVSGSSASFELAADICVWYCTEDSPVMQSLTQRLCYSKTSELGTGCENIRLTVTPKTDYVNCRVINQRRLDIRGAISCRIKGICEHRQEVISDAFGMNIRLRKKRIPCVSSRLYTQKKIILEDEIDVGLSKPPALAIIRSEASANSPEHKIVAGKLVAKGEAQVSALYSSEDGGLEPLHFTLPYSQIIDFDGIDEQHECIVSPEIMECGIIISSNSEGEGKLLKCSVSLMLCCTALKSGMAEVTTDAYSTSYPINFATSKIHTESMPEKICCTHSHCETLEAKTGDIDKVCDCFCNTDNIAISPIPEEGYKISGRVTLTVIARGVDGKLMLLEKTDDFDFIHKTDEVANNIRPDISASVRSCSYNMVSSDSVSVKAELLICGYICASNPIDAITDISINTEEGKRKGNEYALKLYFAREGEEIWEIAKKYGTSAEAIIEENELDEEYCIESGMLLIPII